MGMGGKKKAAPKQEVAAPTVTESKDYADTTAAKNAEAQARVDSNESATLLQVKDDEELKRQQGLA